MMVKREVCSNFMADNCSCFVLCLLSNVWGLLPALCLGWLLVVVGGGGNHGVSKIEHRAPAYKACAPIC